MAEGFSVKAVLSAVDRGFTSTMKSALSSVKSLASTVGSGMIMGAGMAAFNKLTGAASGLVKEVDSSNAAWKTFSSNMGMLGKSSGEIRSVKKELQDFAQQTVYSSSDMASTFAQLEAVGTKNTLSLVKGFGGLAAAAEDPQQAMKTLSMQATQMAAKPKVAWEDFKLMLEQTPAGVAAVAKQMGMSAEDMVAAVQDGKIATEDFFDAISEVGTNDAFTKLATESKTVGQAMDGLTETVGNKLLPAFDYLSGMGIKAIDQVAKSFEKIDGEAIKKDLVSCVKAATPYWNTFKSAVSNVWKIISGVGKKMGPVFESAGKAIAKTVQKINRSIAKLDAKDIVAKIGGGIDKAVEIWETAKSSFKGVGTALGEAFAAVKDSVLDMLGAFKGTGSMESFKGIMDDVASAVKKAAEFIEENSDTIVRAIPYILAAVAAFKTFKAVSKITGVLSKFGSAIQGIALKALRAIPRLGKFNKKQEETGKKSRGSSKQLLASAKAFMMVGAGAFLTSAGFALLAQSAIKLADAGGPAIGVMVGLAAAVGALMLGTIKLLSNIQTAPKKISAMSGALLAMGAAVLLISAGFALMAYSAIQLSSAGGLAVGAMLGMAAACVGLILGMVALLKVVTASPAQIAKMSMAMLALGASVLLISAGFGIMAFAAIQLSNAGGLAVGTMFGMLVAIGALLAIVGTFGAGISAASVGLLAFGACVLMICAGLALAQGAFTALAPLVTALGDAVSQVASTIADGVSQIVDTIGSVLVQAFQTAGEAIATVVTGISEGIATINDSIANVIEAIGTGLSSVLEGIADVISSVGESARDAGEGFKAAAEGIQLMADLGLGDTIKAIGSVGAAMGEMAGHSETLPAVAAGLTAIGTALVSISAGAAGFGTAVTALSTASSQLSTNMEQAKAALTGFTLPSIDPSPVASAFQTVSTAAGKVTKDIGDIGTKAASGFNSGMSALGSSAKSHMSRMISTFKTAGNQAKAVGKTIGTGFTKSVQAGLAKAPAIARQAVNSITVQLRSGYSNAYSAGAYISQGFAAGMLSCLGAIQAAAAQMVAAANAAVRAKAMIHSPSKLFEKNGAFMGEGQEKGILSKVKDVWNATKKLVQIPDLKNNRLRVAYAGEISADYDYYRNNTYTIIVPVDLDGKEVARVTAPYTQEELEKRQRREEWKKGRV